LTKHFASCGEITQIYVPRDFKKKILKRYFCGFEFAANSKINKTTCIVGFTTVSPSCGSREKVPKTRHCNLVELTWEDGLLSLSLNPNMNLPGKLIC